MTAPTPTDQSFLQDVRGCSRCGGDHDSLRFAPFKNLPSFLVVSHWAMCPTTSEPVLLWFEPDEDEGGDGEPGDVDAAILRLLDMAQFMQPGAQDRWEIENAATLLRQMESQLAALRGVPVPAGRRDAEAEAQQAADAAYEPPPAPELGVALNVIVDGPAGQARFVDVETDDGRSVRDCKWRKRQNGLWALRISLPATPPSPPAGDPGQDDVGELIHLLRMREQSLSQQGFNLVQLGDAAYFGRAASRLEQQEAALATLVQQMAEPAKALVVPVNHQRLSELGSELPWNRPGWCDAEGRCWLCNAYSMGRWNYDIPPDPAQDWGRLGTVTHCAPHWAIPRPRPVPRADAGEAQG